ncbi:uncharacterized protein LOC143178139 [Calliopsis andreniformis]|uniref:uncharacterized protein LOC143178139 n=1 Tax=Calliopsis andreniformis TaxID=337506 RepID=UPI003FCDA28F
MNDVPKEPAFASVNYELEILSCEVMARRLRNSARVIESSAKGKIRRPKMNLQGRGKGLKVSAPSNRELRHCARVVRVPVRSISVTVFTGYMYLGREAVNGIKPSCKSSNAR